MKRKIPNPSQKVARALKFLGENRLMTLATAAKNAPWVATVFFAYDKKFRILFYSRPDTRHCRSIEKDPRVAVAVNHAWRGKDGLLRGLQLSGRARRAPETSYAKWYAVYKKRIRWADDFREDHVIYLIEPEEVWYIDEEFFGHFFRERIL